MRSIIIVVNAIFFEKSSEINSYRKKSTKKNEMFEIRRPTIVEFTKKESRSTEKGLAKREISRG